MANLLDTGKRIINLDAIIIIGSTGVSGFCAPKAYFIEFNNNKTIEMQEEELTRQDLIEVLKEFNYFHELPHHEGT